MHLLSLSADFLIGIIVQAYYKLGLDGYSISGRFSTDEYSVAEKPTRDIPTY